MNEPSAVTRPFQHVVITRFNVQLAEGAPTASDLWLRDRLELFLRYTLPSMKNQTMRPDRWMILCDDRSPIWFREVITAATQEVGDIVWLSKRFSRESVSDAIANSHPYLITTRIDNDDCVASDFVQTIQSEFQPSSRLFINFTNGAQFCDGRLYRRADPSNAFISLIEEQAPEGPVTVFVGRHDRLATHGPIRQVRVHPMWVQIVHGKNIANSVHGVRTGSRSSLKYFPVGLQVRPMSRVLAAAYGVGTASGLAMRVIAKPRRLKWLWMVSFGRADGLVKPPS